MQLAFSFYFKDKVASEIGSAFAYTKLRVPFFHLNYFERTFLANALDGYLNYLNRKRRSNRPLIKRAQALSKSMCKVLLQLRRNLMEENCSESTLITVEEAIVANQNILHNFAPPIINVNPLRITKIFNRKALKQTEPDEKLLLLNAVVRTSRRKERIDNGAAYFNLVFDPFVHLAPEKDGVNILLARLFISLESALASKEIMDDEVNDAVKMFNNKRVNLNNAVEKKLNSLGR